jgi:membrane-associated phospholipid phosphatase
MIRARFFPALFVALVPASAMAEPPPLPADPAAPAAIEDALPPLASPSPARMPGAPRIPAPAPPLRPMLRYDLVADGTRVVAGGAAFLALELTKAELAPRQCRWCNPPGIDTATRDALRWSNPSVPGALSYVTGYALAPLAAYGLDAVVVLTSGGSAKEWAVDALIITEAILSTVDLNQFVKFAAARERPFVHQLSPEEKRGTGAPGDNNLSFFSGHTSLAFSAAAASGAVATVKGYKAAPWIWATGMTIAAATGYLRIAADKHYLTDVLTGAVLGTAIGFAVPYYHRPCTSDRPCVTAFSASTVDGGAMVGMRGLLF